MNGSTSNGITPSTSIVKRLPSTVSIRSSASRAKRGFGISWSENVSHIDTAVDPITMAMYGRWIA